MPGDMESKEENLPIKWEDVKHTYSDIFRGYHRFFSNPALIPKNLSTTLKKFYDDCSNAKRALPLSSTDRFDLLEILIANKNETEYTNFFISDLMNHYPQYLHKYVEAAHTELKHFHNHLRNEFAEASRDKASADRILQSYRNKIVESKGSSLKKALGFK